VTLRDVLIRRIRRDGALTIADFMATVLLHPEQGYYYRSEQFSLAKHGVPAFSVKSGSKYPGRPGGWGDEKVAQYRESHYHQPSDEFREDWDFGGIADLARFGFELGRIVADQPDLPTWKQGDEFLAARERSWK